MSQFKIRYADLENQKKPLKKISKEIDNLADDIKSIRRNMDTETSSISRLERRLSNYQLTLEELAEDISKYSTVLEDIAEAYEKSEKYVYSSIDEVKTNIQAESVTNMWMNVVGDTFIKGPILTNPLAQILYVGSLIKDEDLRNKVYEKLVNEIFKHSGIDDWVFKQGDKFLDKVYEMMKSNAYFSSSTSLREAFLGNKKFEKEWIDELLDLDLKDGFEKFGETTVGKIFKGIFELGGEAIENYKEFGEINGQFIGETITETAVDLGVDLLIGGAVAGIGLLVGGLPAIAVGALTIGGSIAVDWASEKIFGKDLGEVVSDFIFGNEEEGKENILKRMDNHINNAIDGAFDLYDKLVNAPSTGSACRTSYA